MLFKRGVIQCSFTVTYFSFLLKIHIENIKNVKISFNDTIMLQNAYIIPEIQF